MAAVPVPAARPPAPSAPQVSSWDETSHFCQAGDTFEAISRRYYQGSPAFAKALQLYNRNHPRATDRMHREGTPTAGETVYVPPQEILERRHGDAILKLNASPAAPGVLPTSPGQ